MNYAELVYMLRATSMGWITADHAADRIEALAAERDEAEQREKTAADVAVGYLQRAETAEVALKEAVEVLTLMMRSVCGPTGFAETVRYNSGLAYPWPSLEAAEAKARALLAKHGGA